MSNSLFDEDIGNGQDIPERPDFSEDIRQFGAHTISKKRENLRCWLFIDFYDNPEKFIEITTMLQSYINGTHQLDREFFYELVKEKFNKG